MTKPLFPKTLIFIGVTGVAIIGVSWVLDVRVAELAELVRSRQGLAGIGEAAAQDVYQTLQIAKTLSYGVGLAIGAICGTCITVALGAVQKRTIQIHASNLDDLERLRNALCPPGAQEVNFRDRVNYEEFR